MKKILLGSFLLYAGLLRPQTHTVLFDFDRSALTARSKMTIDSFLIETSKQTSPFSIVLTGHCDARGRDGYNDSLSKKRVLAVKDYINRHAPGLEKKITSAISYGEKRPLNDNISDEDRKKNRRVEIYLAKQESVSLTETLADTTVRPGTSIALRNINFVGGRHLPLPESHPALLELFEAMKNYPRLVIEVVGNICCQEGDEDGIDQETSLNNLSEARAKRIADWLIYKGIDSNRVSYRGAGHSNPIYPYPEKTEDERIANRRVEIKIISK